MIQYYDWLPQLESIEGVCSIANRLLVFSYSDIKTYFQSVNPFHAETIGKPHKFDFFMIILHKAGGAKIKVDMEEYEVLNPRNIIKIVPGQILSIENLTPDFDADIVLMSIPFVEELLVYINGTIPFTLDKKMNVLSHCSEHELNSSELFMRSLRHVLINSVDNPHLEKIVQHVMMAIFYSSVDSTDTGSEKPRANADILTKEFLTLVKANFREERQLKFYADKMCITPRYLSRVVKECTQFSAADWIERFVVLEARALLKSTNMTVQQISDELNFPSQTFFGKYFKRRVGLSPKEYRRKG